MTAPRRSPVVAHIGAALCSAGATAMFLLLAYLAPPGAAQPVLLVAAAITGCCAWRCVR